MQAVHRHSDCWTGPFVIERPNELRSLVIALADRLATSARRVRPTHDRSPSWSAVVQPPDLPPNDADCGLLGSATVRGRRTRWRSPSASAGG